MRQSPNQRSQRRLLPVVLLGAPWLLGIGLLASAEQALKDGLTRWLLESCGGAAPALAEASRASGAQSFTISEQPGCGEALVMDIRIPEIVFTTSPEVDCEVDVAEITARARLISVEAREQARLLASAATPHAYRFSPPAGVSERGAIKVKDDSDAWITFDRDLAQ